ncbi:MAG: hypothetical protein JWO03_3420 [Bacteroidetes bacterium]|nr:hypothetical protein [Bacteroidota bacterium]
MRHSKRNSRLSQYLFDAGVLPNGTDEEIKAARKAYWNEYSRQRMQRTRKAQKRQFSMSFPSDEITRIRATMKAKSYKSIQAYIRACTLADVKNLVVLPHSEVVADILQVLRLCFNKLDAIKGKEGKGFFATNRTYENVETVLKQTEQHIRTVLESPIGLRELIQESIKRNPDAIILLRSILKEHVGNQEHDEKNK